MNPLEGRKYETMKTLPKQIPSDWPVYRVIRFRFGGTPRTIKTCLTEAEAQAHCSRPDTRGDGWFDGYDLMKGYRRAQS